MHHPTTDAFSQPKILERLSLLKTREGEEKGVVELCVAVSHHKKATTVFQTSTLQDEGGGVEGEAQLPGVLSCFSWV
jgi:hypothetical protein